MPALTLAKVRAVPARCPFGREGPEGADGGSFPTIARGGRGRRAAFPLPALHMEGDYTSSGPASPGIPPALSLGSRSVPPVAAITEDGGPGALPDRPQSAAAAPPAGSGRATGDAAGAMRPVR